MIQNISPLYTTSSVIATSGLQPIKNIQQTKPEAQFTSDAVKLTLSPEAQRLLEKYETSQEKTKEESYTKSNTQSTDTTLESKKHSDPASEISPEEERLLQRLKQSDLDVKTHEHQHVAMAGGYVKSGPVYEYITGPDGKRYAVGGHVSLDMSPVPNNPEATIRKAQVIKRAALAPADPSGADRAVAAAANKMEVNAREQLKTEQEKNIKIAIAKGQNSKVKAYTKPNCQLGHAVNILL